MQTLEQANHGAVDLYRLAYLLTGRPEPSIDATLEAIDFEDAANPFFSTWMFTWSRRLVISKALAAIRDELAASARQTASSRSERAALPPRTWTLGRGTTKLQIESALLAIDVFPRCALLLLVFERVSIEDAAILLDCHRDLVRKGQVAGLRELTRNLARMQGVTSKVTRPILASDMQPA